MTSIADHISYIFREIEADLGTRDLDKLVIGAFHKSLTQFQPRDSDDLIDQLYELVEVVKNTKPRIALIIEHFYVIWKTLEELSGKDREDSEKCKVVILKSLRALKQKMRKENASLLQHGVNSIETGDTILIHSHSHTVLDILRYSRNKGKKFRVIVAQQEFEKTHAIIEFLNAHRIPFQVVPEYMLSHIEGEVDKVFLGGLTLNSSHNFVVDSGTMSIVSEFHVVKKPIYMFLSTAKFSMWQSKEVHHTYKVKTVKSHCRRLIDYEHVKFSHDRVPLDLFDYVVTETGKFTPNEVKKIYNDAYKKREEWRNTFFKEG